MCNKPILFDTRDISFTIGKNIFVAETVYSACFCGSILLESVERLEDIVHKTDIHKWKQSKSQRVNVSMKATEGVFIAGSYLYFVFLIFHFLVFDFWVLNFPAFYYLFVLFFCRKGVLRTDGCQSLRQFYPCRNGWSVP